VITDRQFAQPSIFARAKAPEGLTCEIRPGPDALDLSLVTSVRLRVRIGARSDVDAVWTTTILQQRIDKLVVRHVFDVAGLETVTPGRYRIIPELIYHREPTPPATTPIPDGVRRAAAFYLSVAP
jgi:hypothetical protein